MVEDVGLLEVGLVEPTVRRDGCSRSSLGAQHHDKEAASGQSVPERRALSTGQEDRMRACLSPREGGL